MGFNPEIENSELLKSRCPFVTVKYKVILFSHYTPPPQKYQRKPHHDFRHYYTKLESIIYCKTDINFHRL